MANIDNLNIGITASVTRAINSIDTLITRIDRLNASMSAVNGSGLTELANGVNRLSTAMQAMNGVGTADFTRLARNIERLTNLNTAGLNRAAHALNTMTVSLGGLGSVPQSAVQLSDLANSIARLGGARVNQAITNIPLLTTAMQNLLTNLSQAPAVSQQLINFTNALANLANQGNRIGPATRSLTSSLNATAKPLRNTKNGFNGIASAIGKFYATYFLAIRGIKKIGSTVKQSMDYVETLNYFKKSFSQVANTADLSSFSELGYKSAEEYAKSFENRAKDLTAKMTGFQINENGTLTSTGQQSLGIDATKLMNNQAVFAQISSSMGVTSDQATKLSQILTEIGGDLASVKNMSFDKVWGDMASGLVGMSRTLDKYGVNIRNVNLQTKLAELGIQANITALNQNDKALLRTIILLDSTKYVWGDLSSTLNQPANQLRMLRAGFSNLSRTIGNLFLPLVSQLLPYINALVISLQRLFTWIGNLFGVDISGITSLAGGGGNTALSDLADQADDLETGLDNSANSAKKLKDQLMGFDEINKLQDDTDTSSGTNKGLSAADAGLLDAAFNKSYEEYQKAWDLAFANVENRAQQLANNFDKLFAPLKEIIVDFRMGDFFKAGQDTGNLIKGIFNWISDVIDNVDWISIGKKIGRFLAGLDWIGIFKTYVKLKFNIWKAIAEIWIGSFEEAPLETALITAFGFMKFTAPGKFLATSLLKVTKNKIIDLAKPMFANIPLKSIGMTAGKVALVAAVLYFTYKAIKWAKSRLAPIFDKYDLEEIQEASQMMFDDWFGHNKLSTELSDIFVFTSTLIADPAEIGNAIKLWWKDVCNGDWEINFWGIFTLPSYNDFTGAMSELWKDIKSGDFKFDLFGIFEFPSVNELGSAFKEMWKDICNGDFKFKFWNNSELPSINELGSAFKDLWKDVCSGNFKFKLWNNMELPSINELGSALKLLWEDILSGDFKLKLWNIEFPSYNELKAGFINVWNAFANWVNDLLHLEFDGLYKSFNVFGKNVSVGIPGFDVQLGQLPTYQTGGFPEDGLFMANHNELVGQFSNGKTAVANNNQITDGIANAVYPAVYNAVMQAMSGRQQQGDIKVYVGNREITDVVIDGINNTIRSTGQSPLLI